MLEQGPKIPSIFYKSSFNINIIYNAIDRFFSINGERFIDSTLIIIFI